MACRSPFGDRWAAKQHLSWSFNCAALLEDASHWASCNICLVYIMITVASIHPAITQYIYIYIYWYIYILVYIYIYENSKYTKCKIFVLSCFFTFVELHEWRPWHSRHEFHGRSRGPRQDEATWGLPSSVKSWEIMIIDCRRWEKKITTQPYPAIYQSVSDWDIVFELS